MEFWLKNTPTEISRIGAEVESFAREHGVAAVVQQALDLALVEWVTNIVSYGYEDSAEHLVRVRLTREEDGVRVEVEDDGRMFNPLEYPPVDTSLPLAEKPVGGLGIHMIRSLMDSMEYTRRGEKNVLTMTKRAKR